MRFARENDAADILFSLLNFSDNENANPYLNKISYIMLVSTLACLVAHHATKPAFVVFALFQYLPKRVMPI